MRSLTLLNELLLIKIHFLIIFQSLLEYKTVLCESVGVSIRIGYKDVPAYGNVRTFSKGLNHIWPSNIGAFQRRRK